MQNFQKHHQYSCLNKGVQLASLEAGIEFVILYVSALNFKKLFCFVWETVVHKIFSTFVIHCVSVLRKGSLCLAYTLPIRLDYLKNPVKLCHSHPI
jgi:hypothetical protein